MPTDPNGAFSLIPSYFAQAGTTIRTEQHNPVLEDIAQGISGRLMRDGRNGMVGNLNMGSFRITNLAPGTDASDAATVGQGVPIGTIIDHVGVAPEGWLGCYGQAISRTAYPILFAQIGTTFGNGDGSTTFNVPDLRGRVTAGRDNMGGASAGRLSDFYGAAAIAIGGVLGAAAHVLSLNQMPRHAHSGETAPAGAHSHTVPTLSTQLGGGPYGTGSTTTGSITTSQAPNHTHSFATDQQGGGEAHGNAQPTMMVNKLIRATY